MQDISISWKCSDFQIVLTRMRTANGERSPIYDRAIDDYRPIKVICIGAGVSGVLTAIRFPQRIPKLELVIYEKNSDIGGTWHENRYGHLKLC